MIHGGCVFTSHCWLQILLCDSTCTFCTISMASMWVRSSAMADDDMDFYTPKKTPDRMKSTPHSVKNKTAQKTPGTGKKTPRSVKNKTPQKTPGTEKKTPPSVKNKTPQKTSGSVMKSSPMKSPRTRSAMKAMKSPKKAMKVMKAMKTPMKSHRGKDSAPRAKRGTQGTFAGRRRNETNGEMFDLLKETYENMAPGLKESGKSVGQLEYWRTMMNQMKKMDKEMPIKEKVATAATEWKAKLH